MKLTKKQEQALINVGLQTLLRQLNGGVTTVRKPRETKIVRHKWTEAQRKKFSATMRAKWAERKRK
jgi:hypothetical protein